MKTKIKKIIEKVSKNYVILFEATESLNNKWYYFIIYDYDKNQYIAGWNNIKKINNDDLQYFYNDKDAKQYILNAIE